MSYDDFYQKFPEVEKLFCSRHKKNEIVLFNQTAFKLSQNFNDYVACLQCDIKNQVMSNIQTCYVQFEKEYQVSKEMLAFNTNSLIDFLLKSFQCISYKINEISQCFSTAQIEMGKLKEKYQSQQKNDDSLLEIKNQQDMQKFLQIYSEVFLNADRQPKEYFQEKTNREFNERQLQVSKDYYETFNIILEKIKQLEGEFYFSEKIIRQHQMLGQLEKCTTKFKKQAYEANSQICFGDIEEIIYIAADAKIDAYTQNRNPKGQRFQTSPTIDLDHDQSEFQHFSNIKQWFAYSNESHVYIDKIDSQVIRNVFQETFTQKIICLDPYAEKNQWFVLDKQNIYVLNQKDGLWQRIHIYLFPEQFSYAQFNSDFSQLILFNKQSNFFWICQIKDNTLNSQSKIILEDLQQNVDLDIFFYGHDNNDFISSTKFIILSCDMLQIYNYDLQQQKKEKTFAVKLFQYRITYYCQRSQILVLQHQFLDIIYLYKFRKDDHRKQQIELIQFSQIPIYSQIRTLKIQRNGKLLALIDDKNQLLIYHVHQLPRFNFQPSMLSQMFRDDQ